MSKSDRISWPRRVERDTPIVGWHCRNCDHEIEHAYQPSLLRRCPNCGGNQQGVRGFEVEPFVEERRERLRKQLRERYGPEPFDGDEPACAVCGTTDDVSADPDEELESIEYRCDEHRRFPSFWWQPGDHPSLLVRKWIETCDRCEAEFTSIYGITDAYRHQEYTEDICLRCMDPEMLRSRLEADR